MSLFINVSSLCQSIMLYQFIISMSIQHYLSIYHLSVNSSLSINLSPLCQSIIIYQSITSLSIHHYLWIYNRPVNLLIYYRSVNLSLFVSLSSLCQCPIESTIFLSIYNLTVNVSSFCQLASLSIRYIWWSITPSLPNQTTIYLYINLSSFCQYVYRVHPCVIAGIATTGAWPDDGTVSPAFTWSSIEIRLCPCKGCEVTVN